MKANGNCFRGMGNQDGAKFVGECVNIFGDAAQIFGVPCSIGQIYGLLFASPVPLSFSDIIVELEISKGSASQGLQFLRNIGAIKIASEKGRTNRSENRLFSDGTSSREKQLGGYRREYFEPELSLRKLIGAVLRDRIAPTSELGQGRLRHLRELANRTSEENQFYLSRVRQLEVWQRRLRTVLPILSNLLGSKNIRANKESN